jgi:cellulose synthase/poly-beta-1,6-N-acetylglucosamine synthase-like glycosyltransferase
MSCLPAPSRATGLSGRPGIADVLIAVPVRNEAARVGGCLSSVGAAVNAFQRDARLGGRPVPRIITVAALDCCTDRTAEVVARFPWVRTRHAAVGRVGAARSIAVAHALELTTAAAAQTWIVNTDADSRVPRDWLIHQLGQADAGADLVCGLVDPDQIECGPTRYAAWRAAYLRVDGHPHVHGANLGIRADCYLDCGGFANRVAHEDVSLVRAAETRGWHVVASRGATVHTSGRPDGRVEAGGFAGYLRSTVLTEASA